VTVNPSTDDIYVLGAVVHPGRYDYVEGDELGDLLALVGLHPRADSTRAILQRFRDSSRWDTVSVELEPIRQGVTKVPLQAGDRILVRAIGDWHNRSTMDVQGAVAFPGPIPIQRGTVTAAQAIEMAGGFLADAVPSRVILAKPFLPDTTAATNPTTGVKATAMVGKNQRLHERTLDLTHGSGPLVEPGDILHVPRSEPWIEVLGRVRNPGFYAYHPDWGVEDYIGAAGGYGKFADYGKTLVSKGRFGEVGYAEDVEALAPGDVVWVPEKIPQGFWKTVRDVVVTAGQGAVLLLVVRDLSQ
jgi:protein involved in polysaccharide export with SLBB domain